MVAGMKRLNETNIVLVCREYIQHYSVHSSEYSEEIEIMLDQYGMSRFSIILIIFAQGRK